MEFNLWSVAFHVWQSICLSGLASIICLVVGGGAAWYEYQRHTAPPRWFLGLCLATIFLPQLYIGFSFMIMFGQTGLLYTPWAIVLSYCYYNIPLAYLAWQTILARWPRHYQNSAAVLGATPHQVWWTITWPRLRRSVLGIGSIIFLYCFTSFLLPLLLGGIHYATLEVYIYELITEYHNFTTAGIFALVQTVLLIGIVLISQLGQDSNYETITVSSKITRWRWWHVVSALVFISPILSVLSKSNFYALAKVQFWPALSRSLGLSAVVIIAVLLITQIPRLSRFSWLWLTLSPVTASCAWLIWVGPGFWSVLLALMCAALPLAGYLYNVAWSRRPVHLLSTAAVLGANRWQQWLLHCRWIGPVWLSMACVTAAVVLGDATVSQVLLPSNSTTAMARSFQLMSSYHGSAAAAGMTTVVLIMFSLIILSHTFYGTQQS